MLLAAGLGTRLRPLTDLRPKPIVPVANKPLGAFALEHLARSGVTDVVANTHPQPEKVETALKAACPPGVALRFSREEKLLGTGGGLHKARAWFDGSQSPVIVMNGDTLFAPDLDTRLIRQLDRYAKCIGLAFQIRDDILDISGNTRELGKTRGKDQAQDKPTYPSLLGLSGAQEKAESLYLEALQNLESLDDGADPLRWIAGYIVGRTR